MDGTFELKQENVVDFEEGETSFIKSEPLADAVTKPEEFSGEFLEFPNEDMKKIVTQQPAQRTQSKRSRLKRPKGSPISRLDSEFCAKTLLNICRGCGNDFATAQSLKRHIVSVHLKMKSYACAECGRAFAVRQTLISHIDSVHRKVRTFQCLRCPKTFYHRGNFLKHLDSIHGEYTRKQKFECDTCHHAFVKLANLSKHIELMH